MSDPLRVSNHALLRYIERVIGIDVEALRAELVSLAQPGSPELSKIIIEDGCVVTVLGDNMRPKKKQLASKQKHKLNSLTP